MTGQGALFSAPQIEGQGALFGATFEVPPAATTAGGPAAELEDQADELAARRVQRQRDRFNARNDELRDHRLTCGNCIPGARPCRDGRKLETEARVASDALRALLAGEL